jgi:putative transposase
MEFRKSGHSLYATQYHIVWIPKYRRRILNPGVQSYLAMLLSIIIKTMAGVEIVEKNILVDHVHMVIIIPPKFSVSDVIGRIKGQTASQLRKKYSWLRKVYWAESIVWSPGYCVSSVGLNEDQIIQYVKWQERQDSGQAKLVLQ